MSNNQPEKEKEEEKEDKEEGNEEKEKKVHAWDHVFAPLIVWPLMVIGGVIVVALISFLIYNYYTERVNRKKMNEILNNPRPKSWKQVINKIQKRDNLSENYKKEFIKQINYQKKWGILVDTKNILCVNKDKWREALTKTAHIPQPSNHPSWLYLQENDVDNYIKVLGNCRV